LPCITAANVKAAPIGREFAECAHYSNLPILLRVKGLRREGVDKSNNRANELGIAGRGFFAGSRPA